MQKTALPQHFTSVKPSRQSELEALDEAMKVKYGVGYVIPAYLSEIVQSHPNWYVKRYNGHRWEVRTGIKDNTYYGETLNEAFCHALLELP